MEEPLYRVDRGERGWVVHVSDEVGAEELAEALDSLTARVIWKRSRDAPKPRRRFGAMKGKIGVPDAFFDPLPGDELEAWEQ